MKWDPAKKLALIICYAILALAIGRYYKGRFILGDSFYALNFTLTLVIPILLNVFYLKIPWRDLGIRKPEWHPLLFVVICFAALLLPILMAAALSNQEYVDYYRKYTDSQTALSDRLKDFVIFTFSTLVGWTFLHRSFLLFGIRDLLSKNFKLPGNFVSTLCVLWVCTFETIYHFLKPDLEAFGMFGASIILSSIAIRTKSIWAPLAIHLYIECLFISGLFYVSNFR